MEANTEMLLHTLFYDYTTPFPLFCVVTSPPFHSFYLTLRRLGTHKIRVYQRVSLHMSYGSIP